MEALNDKYVDTGELDTEKVVLGSSNGAIIVEAPRLSKVRGRLADLHHLREVSFDPAVVNGPGSPLEIARICQSTVFLPLRNVTDLTTPCVQSRYPWT